MHTADANIANTSTQSMVIKNVGMKLTTLKSILFPSTIPAVLTVYAVIKDIDRRLRIAAPTAMVETARNFAVISSVPVTGRVSMVSRVPLSFSPAVVSIAGYIAPIRMLTMRRNGMIYPMIKPTFSSLLE